MFNPFFVRISFSSLLLLEIELVLPFQLRTRVFDFFLVSCVLMSSPIVVSRCLFKATIYFFC